MFVAVGRVWINVADYVDKGQLINANLDKGGYVENLMYIIKVRKGNGGRSFKQFTLSFTDT